MFSYNNKLISAQHITLAQAKANTKANELFEFVSLNDDIQKVKDIKNINLHFKCGNIINFGTYVSTLKGVSNEKFMKLFSDIEQPVKKTNKPQKEEVKIESIEAPKARGRPKKITEEVKAEPVEAPKARGRPKKITEEVQVQAQASAPKPRGRPKKEAKNETKEILI